MIHPRQEEHRKKHEYQYSAHIERLAPIKEEMMIKFRQVLLVDIIVAAGKKILDEIREVIKDPEPNNVPVKEKKI